MSRFLCDIEQKKYSQMTTLNSVETIFFVFVFILQFIGYQDIASLEKILF